MIDPTSIPRIDGDMTALAAHADAIERTGFAVTETGATVHQIWQELAGVYRAPEADQLLAATGPVQARSASIGEDIEDAASALRVYAADVGDIQKRLDALRVQASALRGAYDAAQDESTTVTLDDRATSLSADVAAQIAAWERAQLRCANAIRSLIGEPSLTSFTSAMTLVEPGGGITVTPRGPTGPMREIFPIDPTPPVSSTGHPPVVTGPGILITVPSPPGTGIIDGPGSYVPFPAFGPYLDKATSDSGPGAEGDPGPARPDDVGSSLRTIEDVLANPGLLRGKTPEEVQEILGRTPNWEVETLGKGRSKGLGWVLREYTPDGNPTGKHLRYHPGGGHHGPDPYWRVIGQHGDAGGIIQ